MPKLSDYYIFSDVDGTVYSHITHKIPERNLEAIGRFIAAGGHFALATGRPGIGLKNIIDKVPVNFPCICVNGGGIYDTVEEKYLNENFLPPHTEAVVKKLMEIYPHFDAAIMAESGYYYVADPEKTIGKMQLDRYILNPNMEDGIEGNWRKVVFFVPEEDCARHIAEIKAMDFEGIDVVSSDTYFVELVPKGISKASALHKICEMFDIPLENTFAIGDYYNDLELLKAAGTSFCVEGAPQDIKDVVDHVLGPCEDGALADLIEYLEKKCDEN